MATRLVTDKKHVLFSTVNKRQYCKEGALACVMGTCACLEDRLLHLNDRLNRRARGRVVAIQLTEAQTFDKIKVLEPTYSSIFTMALPNSEFCSDGSNVFSLHMPNGISWYALDKSSILLYRVLREELGADKLNSFIRSIHEGMGLTPKVLNEYTRSIHTEVLNLLN